MTPERTREKWLLEAVALLRPSFEAAKYDIPERVRVATSWPATGGTRKKNRVIGSCTKPHVAADGVSQIAISPILIDPVEVLGVLVHELIHAVLPDAAHRKPFAKAVTVLGLEGKPTATTVGDRLRGDLLKISESLGEYPHAALNLDTVVKKQTTRMIKLYCASGEHAEEYILRGSKKVLEFGLPKCPLCEVVFSIDGPEGDEGDPE